MNAYSLRVNSEDDWPESMTEAKKLADAVPELLRAGKELRQMADPKQNMSDIPLLEAMSRWDKIIRTIALPTTPQNDTRNK